jgi:hypothetical protein
MSDVADDIDELTQRVINNLDPGYYEGKLVLSRRQAVTLGISASALVALGFGEAEAQDAAGQVGTDSERVDVFAESINDGGPITDGDDTERQLYVIANGASDPSGAGPEDLIFEEQ